jgi:aminomethyltransferase
VARTGYTGEDGFEISVEQSDSATVWQALLSGGAVPVGLAARDSLRLEAGLPLYGHELTADRSPLDSGFGRVVDFDHEFVGRGPILTIEQAGGSETLVGLVCAGKRAARPEYPVRSLDGRDVGIVTSGGPSPTLGVPIAMAYVARGVAALGTEVAIDIRNRPERATVVALPFLRSLPRPDAP